MRNKLETIEGQLQTLADFRKRPVLCIIGELNGETVQEVRRILPELRDSEDRYPEKLSVLLESPGGYIEDSYRIALALREHVKDLEVLVPNMAKSAATFFCLAANTIYLGPHGELGPLDPQRQNLRGSAVYVSALESFNALHHLLGYSLDSLDGVVQHLLAASFRREAPMDIPYAIEHAQPLVAAIVSALFSQVDPRELGDAGMALAVSEEYAERAMRRWGYSNVEPKKRQEIARRLTWGYPSHGFVIDFTEAKEIGLNVEEIDPDAELLCQLTLRSTTDFIGLQFPDTKSNQAETNGETEIEGEERSKHDTEKGDETSERSPDGRPHAISA